MAYRKFEDKNTTVIAGVLLIVAAVLSLWNLWQWLLVSILLLIAGIMCFVGGGKPQHGHAGAHAGQPGPPGGYQ